MQQRGNCPALLRGVDGRQRPSSRQTGLPRASRRNEEKSSHERPRRHPRRCLHRLRQHRDLALRPGARAGPVPAGQGSWVRQGRPAGRFRHRGEAPARHRGRRRDHRLCLILRHSGAHPRLRGLVSADERRVPRAARRPCGGPGATVPRGRLRQERCRHQAGRGHRGGYVPPARSDPRGDRGR